MNPAHHAASHGPRTIGGTPTTPDSATKPAREGVLFAQLGLIKPLLDALHHEGYATPTPIQAEAIPHAMAGKDILGSAQTGTGKTAAFALPILHRLQSATPDKAHRGPVYPRALILSPTRELCAQIAESFGTYGRNCTLRHTTVFGGVSQFHQVKALRNGVDILVATPGRLMDLMNQRLVNLSQVSIFVLDEADRMLDMGFIEPIRRIASALPPRDLVNRQTMLFSATMPREIVHLAESLLHHPVRVSVSPVSSAAPLIEQSLYVVPKEKKALLLEHLIEEGNVQRAVVFARTKFGAERLGKRLNASGISAESIHGDKNQNARKRALAAFKAGHSRVLVATDVAARGLDVDGITHVFNFDLPFEPEAYIHRIGRTGRAGAKGMAIAFADPGEHNLLRQIERLTKTRIPQVAKVPNLNARAQANAERAATNPQPQSDHEQSHQARRPYGSPRGRAPHQHGDQPMAHGAHRPSHHGDRPSRDAFSATFTSPQQRTRRDSVPGSINDDNPPATATPADRARPAYFGAGKPARAGKPSFTKSGGSGSNRGGKWAGGGASGGRGKFGPKRSGGKPGGFSGR